MWKTLKLAAWCLLTCLAFCGNAIAQGNAAPGQPINAPLPKSEGFEPVWSHPGTFIGVTIDAQSNIYAVDTYSRCTVFDVSGEEDRSFPFAGTGHDHVIASRGTAPNSSFLVLEQGSSALAISTKGKRLWETDPASIRGACIVDLNGDGLDELVVSYHNPVGADNSGVRVYGHDGTEMWHTKLMFAETLCVAKLTPDAKVQVICRSNGRLVIYSADGSEFETIDQNLRFRGDGAPVAVRLPNTKVDTIIETAHDNRTEKEVVVALNDQRTPAWTYEVPPGLSYRLQGTPCPNRPWIVAKIGALRGVALCVLDATNGSILASIDSGEGGWHGTQAIWLPPKEGDPPILVVANGQTLAAYAIRPTTKTNAAK